MGRRARSTERLYRSQPWAQQRGADGAQVRDGTDDSARAQGARFPARHSPRLHSSVAVSNALRALRAGVSRRGLRSQEAEAARLPPTRSAHQRLGGRDPVHAWQDRCALWYAYAYHGRERRIGTAVVLAKRPVSMRWC